MKDVIEALEELEKQEAALRAATRLDNAAWFRTHSKRGRYGGPEYQEASDTSLRCNNARLVSLTLVELARTDLVAAIRRMFTFVDTADEIEASMTDDSLNCPACGGSGHVEDAEDFLRRNYVPRDLHETTERVLGEAWLKKWRRIEEALTPSADAKGEYIGEFKFNIDAVDENGEECTREVTVPWTTTKEIMAAIRKRGGI